MGACLMLPLVTALIYGEKAPARAFALVMLACFLLGGVLRLLFRSDLSAMKVKPRDSYFIVTTTWLIASVAGCLPYILTGAIPDFIEAFFETASGFTTTGSTILTEVESLPRSVLMWRSFTQWLGGMGIIVLFVALLPRFGIKAQNIASAETPGPTVTKLSSRFSGTAQRLYVAYIVLTAMLACLLMCGGVGFYDALNHAFTTMATGGFSTYNNSIAHFESGYITWVITVFMFLAGTNFELFFVAVRGDIKKVLKNEEFRTYSIIILVCTIYVTASLMARGGYESAKHAVTDAAFQVCTIITTTGYATTDFNLWPAFCHMILIMLMFIGGSSSSTAGGIKVIRVMVLFRTIKREIGVKLHGNIVRDISVDRQKVMAGTLTYIIGFVTTYLITLCAGVILISIGGRGDPLTNFTAVLTCISNVGPGLGDAGPVCNFHFYDGFSKMVLALVMIAGRLELSTFFVLFSRFYWDPNKV